MSTIQRLIERIETRLAMVSGLDVQIHAEDRLVEMLRHQYNILYDEFWRDEDVLYISTALDGVTGTVTADLSDIKRFDDILYIFLGTRDDPLPPLNKTINPRNVRTECWVRNSDPTKLFTIWPLETDDTVEIVYRERLSDDVWENAEYEQNISLDDEVLILGVCYDFLNDDGSNPQQEEKFLNKYEMRKKQIRQRQWTPLAKRRQSTSGIPDRWE